MIIYNSKNSNNNKNDNENDYNNNCHTKSENTVPVRVGNLNLA